MVESKHFEAAMKPELENQLQRQKQICESKIYKTFESISKSAVSTCYVLCT